MYVFLDWMMSSYSSSAEVCDWWDYQRLASGGEAVRQAVQPSGERRVCVCVCVVQNEVYNIFLYY